MNNGGLVNIRCGSSPRVWGTHLGRYGALQTNRFIPTGVGNTIWQLQAKFKFAVHPHGCGEHTVQATSVTVVAHYFRTSP